MKKNGFFLVVILVVTLLTACGNQNIEPTANSTAPPTPEDTKNHVKLGEGVSLEVGQTVWVADARMSITLLEISEDSRCPTSVQCFIAGWVTAVLLVEKEGEMGEEILLSLGDPLPEQGSEALLDTVVISLLEVNPYPGEPGTTPQEDYEVVLVVEEVGE